MKPIQTLIESLQAKGVTPRLHVDVTHVDAVCPDFVREEWTDRLVIDLDPSYPLEIEFTPVGVEANLSFGGFVTRCTFPWAAIYIVTERGTGRGRVFEHNVPASRQAELAPGRVDPTLTKAKDNDRGGSSRRRKRRPAKEPTPAVIELAPVEQDPEDEAEIEAESEAEAEAEVQTDQQEVITRRAAFTVIDGG